VSDLDRAVAFYRDVLGLELLSRFEVAGDAFSTAVRVPGATGRFVHFDANGLRLELVEYDPSGEVRANGRLNQPGATHIGLSIEDVDGFYDSLPDEVETLSAPQTTQTGTRILFLRDVDGNLLEFLET
jgi:catechol 2,3-dioxygenase-like lactoylglutathione lyase family enzyme